MLAVAKANEATDGSDEDVQGEGIDPFISFLFCEKYASRIVERREASRGIALTAEGMICPAQQTTFRNVPSGRDDVDRTLDW